ncbi:hypothetical protein [Chamaesiphon sp.]
MKIDVPHQPANRCNFMRSIETQLLLPCGAFPDAATIAIAD